MDSSVGWLAVSHPGAATSQDAPFFYFPAAYLCKMSGHLSFRNAIFVGWAVIFLPETSSSFPGASSFFPRRYLREMGGHLSF
jgi:hypothetical protein